MAKYVLALAIFSLSLALSVELHAQSLEETVVFIKCSPRGGGKPFYGSGVLVSADGKVLTAKHVIPEGREAHCEGSIGIADTKQARSMDIRRRKHSRYDAALLQFPPLPAQKPYNIIKAVSLTHDLIELKASVASNDDVYRVRGELIVKPLREADRAVGLEFVIKPPSEVGQARAMRWVANS